VVMDRNAEGRRPVETVPPNPSPAWQPPTHRGASQ
jgi:hypothetical protein